MLFDSSIRKELGRTVSATVVVIVTIVLTMMLIRTLGQAAAGKASAEDVVLVLGYVTLGFLPMILSLSLFVATIATFTRMYRDSEMAVWLASGVGLTRFIRPTIQTAIPTLILLAVTALVARPWGQAQVEELRDRHEQRSDLSKVSPGEFQASQDGHRVFYIDRRESLAPVSNNVFIVANDTTIETIITAQEGRVFFDKERRLLDLSTGHRTTLDATTGRKTVARFEQATALVNDHVRGRADLSAPRSMNSWRLLWETGPRHQAELAWRLGLVLGGVNLLLLGVGLARGGPRQTSNWNLLAGLLCFVVYYNAMNLVQSWSASGKLAPMPAMLALHGTAFTIAIMLLGWRQHGGFSLLPRLAPRGQKQKTRGRC